jgi:hypothetical protein
VAPARVDLRDVGRAQSPAALAQKPPQLDTAGFDRIGLRRRFDEVRF